MKNLAWKRGDFIELDGLVAVVVGIEGDPNVPEEHLAVWFGEPKGVRKSAGGKGPTSPEVWIVPEEFCKPAPRPEYKH